MRSHGSGALLSVYALRRGECGLGLYGKGMSILGLAFQFFPIFDPEGTRLEVVLFLNMV